MVIDDVPDVGGLDPSVEGGSADGLKNPGAIAALVVHGTATPVLWAIGIIRIVVAAVTRFRHRLLLGVPLIRVGIVLGGLNVF